MASNDEQINAQRRTLRPRAAKRLGRGADHLAGGRADPQDRQAALVRAIALEPENPINSGKARGIGENRFRKSLIALGLYEGRNERHGIIGERRGADRVLAEFRAVTGGKALVALGVRRGVPAALQRAFAEDAWVVP